MSPTIDLIFFDGCPHAESARLNLRAALEAAELPLVWRERNQTDPLLPPEWRRFPSPTVLVNGIDVAGATPTTGGACRVTGAPTFEMIRAALSR